jgi:hypothetical protein
MSVRTVFPNTSSGRHGLARRLATMMLQVLRAGLEVRAEAIRSVSANGARGR